MKKKNLAFTLAEVLIVIGIIGVVAALTLPNLNKATGNKETITRVKKAYSTLTEAFDRAQAIYGDYDTWDEHNCSTESCKLKRISEFMKVSKYCSQAIDEKCWSGDSLLSNQRGNVFNGMGINRASIITPDGISILAMTNSFYIDVDGPQNGKSLYGIDQFMFSISNNQITPSYLSDCSDSFSQLISYLYSTGYCQAYWIIEYDNMDYLKFTDANGTCDNGNVVTESNPSCN